MKVTQSCPTLCNPMDYTYSPWNSPGPNTGVGSHFLLQGNLPDPGIKPMAPAAPPALRADSLPLSHRGGPGLWTSISGAV